MSTWEFETRQPYFGYLEDGSKSYEGRVADKNNPKKQYQDIKLGDLVLIILVDAETNARVDNVTPLRFTVKEISVFRDLDSAFEKFDYRLIDPQARNAEELKETILAFPGYATRVKESGFIIVELEKI